LVVEALAGLEVLTQVLVATLSLHLLFRAAALVQYEALDKLGVLVLVAWAVLLLEALETPLIEVHRKEIKVVVLKSGVLIRVAVVEALVGLEQMQQQPMEEMVVLEHLTIFLVHRYSTLVAAGVERGLAELEVLVDLALVEMVHRA